MIEEYFHTDWAAMTATDWWGLIFTIVIFFCMVGLYYWVLKPSNKDNLEKHCDFVLKEESNTGRSNHE